MARIRLLSCLVSSLALLLMFVLRLFVSSPAVAQNGLWKGGNPYQVSLVPGRVLDNGFEAGLVISLKEDYKTYWRNPGESGLAPVIHFGASSNLRSLNISWPAPQRFEDGNGASYGYTQRVVLPLKAVALDASKPVDLKISLEMGLCKDLCIPVRADVGLLLQPAQIASPLVQEAQKLVPRLSSLGEASPLSIASVTWINPKTFQITARLPEKARPELFAEAPPNWQVFTSEVESLKPHPEGGFIATFLASIAQEPTVKAGTLSLSLTLTAAGQAVETQVQIERPHSFHHTITGDKQ
jgi:DsbC/DsbD-like thiol-disulfide interchange protein